MLYHLEEDLLLLHSPALNEAVLGKRNKYRVTSGSSGSLSLVTVDSKTILNLLAAHRSYERKKYPNRGNPSLHSLPLLSASLFLDNRSSLSWGNVMVCSEH